MATRFKDKLKQIRDASTQRSVIDLKLRSEEDLVKSQRTVKAFEFRESVEAVITELVKSFQAEAPVFVLNRGFFEGKYMLALRLNEELVDSEGRADRYFSRLMFLLDPHTDQDAFDLQCRKTVRNRDLESHSVRSEMTDAGRTTLSEFIEAQFLEFAEQYFGETSLSKPATVSS